MQRPSPTSCPQSALSDLLARDIVQAGIAPHAVAGFAQKHGDVWHFTVGSADSNSERAFDLASISKSFFAVLVSKLVVEGKLCWTDNLDKHLPELRGSYAGQCSVEAHLSHRAGMLPHLELFLGSWSGLPMSRKRLVDRIAGAVNPSRRNQAVYSDLGYLLVGLLVERVCSKPLDFLLSEKVFHPWNLGVGSARSFARTMPNFARDVAPTEIQPSRGGLLRGVVHDDNAWMWAGTGCCGHAGLFANAETLLRFGARLLDEAATPYLLPLLKRRPEGSLRMGFDGVSPHSSSAGQLAGPDTFGHLGFTGTSFWCDPTQERVTVLLTNRVYPTRENPKIKEIRPNVHDFLWSC